MELCFIREKGLKTAILTNNWRSAVWDQVLIKVRLFWEIFRFICINVLLGLGVISFNQGLKMSSFGEFNEIVLKPQIQYIS